VRRAAYKPAGRRVETPAWLYLVGCAVAVFVIARLLDVPAATAAAVAGSSLIWYGLAVAKLTDRI
jgi:hypothetical protein